MTRMIVNGEPIEYRLDPETPLLWALREASNLTGTKYGCDSSDCGSCTVMVDGRAALSCGVPIGTLEGAEVIDDRRSVQRPLASRAAGLARRAGDDVRLLRAGVHHGDRGAAPGEPEPERGADRRHFPTSAAAVPTRASARRLLAPRRCRAGCPKASSPEANAAPRT